MSLPKEPRQKMINIMYLVLTALLALNVSSEILNAFKTVNNSLINSNNQTNLSTGQIFKSLTDKMTKPEYQDKARIWHPIAKDIIDYANEANAKIETMKMELMLAAGGSKTDGSGFKDDQLDAATRVFVKKGRGKELLQLLKDFKDKTLKRDTAINAQFANSLPINLDKPKSSTGDNKKNWEESYFHMVPTIAALTILSKFQNDIKVSENKVVTFCHQKVGEVEVQQDAFAALAVANANYVLPGQEIEVTAGVGGFSTKVSPIININGTSPALGPDGAAHYKFNASGLGEHTIPVSITYTDQNNVKHTEERPIKYTVGQSNAAVQLDKMNVLFIGVDNPITVSGSGDADRLVITAAGGGAVLSGSGAKRTVRVNNENEDCIISVKTPDGKITPVKFRVRSIPDPTPYVGQVKSGDMSASAFKSQAGVRAIVDNFFYETQFNVTSFRITGDGDGFDEGVQEATNSGAAWKEAAKIINKCRAGSFVTIEDIRAVGPDGRTRKLTPMIFNLR
ncbi:MAG TPA: gliding motility protein GldM [Chitinophagaceae bacterium]|nr:gliding motility protein GldM [Chitinophagaceae bacterium]